MNQRRPEFPVHEIFLNRWSPRAMSGEEISQKELMSLFEAAKWAPSSYNNQHWKFIYTLKNSPNWEVFFNLLAEPNKTWVKDAAALVVVLSKNTFDRNGKPAKTHTFDAGAAWENFALQGSISGLAVHGMQGFDDVKAKSALEVPDDHTVEIMIAVGKPGKTESLPEPLQKMESPSDRKKLSEIVFEGKFIRN